MKYFYLFLATVCLNFYSTAQDIHLCAQAKINNASHQPVISAVQQATENKYDVKFHHLQLKIERDTTYISGSVRTMAKVVAATLDTFAFELHPNLLIDSVRVNGSLSVPLRTGNYVGVRLPVILNLGSTIDAKIYYHGTPPSTASAAIGNGFSSKTSGSWGNRVTWSLSESFAAYEWWPCKQSLRDKIDSSYFYITTDTSNKAGSNGKLVNTVILGNGKKRMEWKNNHMIDYYLISVAVAKYIDYSFYANPYNCPQPVLIQNYIYNNPSTLPFFQATINKTKNFLELFSKLYGPYPFWDQKYGHCMAPFGGGMEHQTMTSIGFFNFTITAHELSHQWFGDNATCKTWSDIFMNEGFASYSEYLALQYLDTVNAAPQMLNQHNNIMSQPGGSIWFTDSTNTVRIFDSRLSYNKGAAMLHWIRFILKNDTTFFNVYKTYQQQFKNSTASAMDFKTVLETVSGQNFTTFYNQWFYGEGFPTFGIRWNQVGSTFYLQSTETVSMSSVTPLFVTPVEYKLTRSSGGDTVIRVNQTATVNTYMIPLGGTVTGIVVDPANWIVNGPSVITHDVNFTGMVNLASGKEDVRIYPNPAQDKLYIDLADNGTYTADIYDLTGKRIFEQAVIQSAVLNISSLAKGIYFVKIVGKENRIVKTSRFVKE